MRGSLSGVDSCQRAGLTVLLRFQIDTRLGAKPQAVLWHDKAKQRHIGLIWKWNHGSGVSLATLSASHLTP